ncbi:unnamed protein product, partial [marine sediment metagenome]
GKQHLDDIWDAIEGVADNLTVVPYQFDIATGGAPASGFWQRDNVAAASATELYFNETDEFGGLSTGGFNEMRTDDVIIIGSRTGDGLERYRLTDVASLAANVYTLPVEYIDDSGTDFIDDEQTKFTMLWGRDLRLGGLRDVEVTGVSDLQILGYDGGSDTWVPVENRGNKGIITLEYLYDANQTATPAAGDVAPNAATPATTTILRISDTDANGDSVDFVLDSITQGDLI